MKSLCLVVFLAVFGFTIPLIAEEARYARPDLLLEPSELAMVEVAKRFVILDARSRDAYDSSHIPGALWVDHDDWSSAFKEGGDVDGWSRRIGALGLGNGSKVVVYDDLAMKNAARIWWLLRYWGAKDARLLNGGWKSWTGQGLPVTSEASAEPTPAVFRAQPISQRLATKNQILKLLENNGLQIVDARSTNEFCGTETKSNKRGGAIPGARHLEWSDLVEQKSHRFKTAKELQALFHQAGIDLNRPTATHCQSGGRASVMAFGMELMGAQEVRNYYKGWSEWGNADDTPIKPGEKE